MELRRTNPLLPGRRALLAGVYYPKFLFYARCLILILGIGRTLAFVGLIINGYDPFGAIFGVYRLVDVDLNLIRFWITVQEERDAGDFWSLHSLRHGLTWVLCVVLLAHTWCRSALSMAMVCMVNMTAVAKTRDVNVSGDDGCSSADTGVTLDYGGDIVWSSWQQGLLFSAIYWGSALMGLPASLMINRWGSKRVVLCSLINTLLCTIITPFAAVNGGLLATFFVRFVMGFGGEIVVHTGITVIMAQWIPPAERSTVLALYTSGIQFAIIAGMPVNAALCETRHFLGGWPAIFYISSVIALVAIVLWCVFVDDTPAMSRWISADERSYIEKSLQSQNLGNKDRVKRVPWRQLVLSNPFWCCVTLCGASALVASTLQSYLPTYYKEVLRFDLKANGFFSSVPFLCQWVFKMVFGVAADSLKKRTSVSRTAICKGFNVVGTILVSVFFVALTFTSCGRIALAVLWMSLANAAFSGLVPSLLTSMVCIAPAYTAIVNGISRFAAQLAAIVAPYIVGSVTTRGTADEWRTVFYIMAGTLSAAGVYFLFYGSAEIQAWAKIRTDQDDSPDDEDACTATPGVVTSGSKENDRILVVGDSTTSLVLVGDSCSAGRCDLRHVTGSSAPDSADEVMKL